ncbi:MAG: class I SAM-dependent methyltransferase [Betaproteobacteria bacterium]
MNKNKVESFYDEEASTYDAKRWHGPIGQYVHSTYQRLVFEVTPIDPQKQYLEIGCGTGRFTVPLAERVNKLTAVDISKEMLKVTEEKLRARGLEKKVRLIEGDAKHICLPDAQFDVILSFNAINHIPDYGDVIKEAARLLKPGGVLVLGYPSLFSLYFPYAVLVNVCKKSLRRGVYTKWPSTSYIERLGRTLNLRPEMARGQFHFPLLQNKWLASAVAFGMRALGGLCERGPLRQLASTQIITLRSMADVPVSHDEETRPS